VSAIGNRVSQAGRSADISHGADRRSHVRISVKLPSRLEWTGRRSFSSNCALVNISRVGALVILGKAYGCALPILGVRVHLEVDLAVAKGFRARCLRCEGTVVRISKAVAKPLELGLRISRMEFRDAEGLRIHDASIRRLIDAFGMGAKAGEMPK
jgi:hypothetical protein